MSLHATLVTSLAITLAALSLVAHAADADPSLESRVRALEQQLQQRELQPADTGVRAPLVTADLGNGFTISSADKTYRLKLWTYIHADGRFFLDDNADTLTNTLVLRRARIVAEGNLGFFDYRVMPEFGNGSTTLLDAYAIANLHPAFKVQAGRFKVPIGLEHLQGDTCVAMIERGFPTQLVPQRDTGVAFTGALWDGRLGYQVGVFNGATDGVNRDSDNGDDKDGVLRLYGTPFKHGPEMLSGLSLGVAGSYGVDNGSIGSAASGVLPTFKTSGQNTFFQYNATTTAAHGGHWRAAPQAYFAYGSVGVMGEYTISQQEVTSATEHRDIANHAWQVVGNWVLTGEQASYRGFAPAHPFVPGGDGWGAFEVIARVHQLTVDDEVFSAGLANPNTAASQAFGVGVGVTWHLTNYAALFVNYERTDFDGGGGTTPTELDDRATEHLIEGRVQLIF